MNNRNIGNKTSLGVKLFAVIWVLAAMLGVSILGGIVYVVWHFVSKMW